MSKKAKIKELQSRNTKLRVALKVSIARQVAAQEFAHEAAEETSQNRAYNAYLEALVDELQESLGECQAGRAELQRAIDTDGSKLIAATWREHAKETAVYADELRAELEEVKKERDGWRREYTEQRLAAKGWRVKCGDINQYAARLESQIDEFLTQLGAVREIVT